MRSAYGRSPAGRFPVQSVSCEVTVSQSYESMFPSCADVALPLTGNPFGTNDDPDTVFAIFDKQPGSRVIYERASFNG